MSKAVISKRQHRPIDQAYLCQIIFSRPGFVPRTQFFARVPVRGDRVVVLGPEKGDGDMHLTVSDVLLLPFADQANFPVAEVRVIGPKAVP